jgi:hypothetical protein
MSAPVIAYATDEDVALFAPSDFARLCPRDQVLAAGTDGLFSASDPWTMQSAVVDFTAAGLAPGHIVLLLGPIPPFSPSGEALVVASVASGAVELRRKGMPSGMGQPPGPVTGLGGVEFLVPTLTPQIASASESLNRRFGIGGNVPGRRPEDLAASGEFREATVLTVLHRRFADLAAEAGSVSGAKSEGSRIELERALSRLLARWTCGRGPMADRFGTRVSR